MKKIFFKLILLFIILTSYYPKFNFTLSPKLHIQKIKIENNSIIKSEEIRKKLNFLYKENLFYLNIKSIEESLKNEVFIESFSIKKIYPNTIKIKIIEKKPIAVLQNKKKRFYISNKGELMNFINVKKYDSLPMIFGDGKSFFTLYKNLQITKFPIENIKSFYFFESGRWDLILNDDIVVKLPIKDYLFSLENFILSNQNSSFSKYKIFDYRIKDQLILN